MTRLSFTAPAVVAAAFLIASSARAADDPVRQAVERGVAYLKQTQAADGSWPTNRVGSTALAALALLECDVPPTDPAVERAASFLRNLGTEVDERHTTYCLALMILFFDRLGDPADVPLIQALAARLIGGQNAEGVWSYACPPLNTQEVRQLRGTLRRQAELKAKGELPKPASGGRPPLSKESQQLIARLRRTPVAGPRVERISGGDNSNTQFGVLGLWVARRHGVPVDKAMARTAAHFRGTQHANGGWSYQSSATAASRFGVPTASMTCAGLIGLALGIGNAREVALRSITKLPAGRSAAGKAPPEPTNDPAIRAGLAALGRVVGQPITEAVTGGLSDPYYVLWSVERVAVAYDLTAIDGKEWYGWGAGLLLGSQLATGGWSGKFGNDVDTSFALLFLRRANLASDLTAYLKGAVVLKADVVKDAPAPHDEPAKPEGAKAAVAAKPVPDKPAEPDAARLAAALPQAAGRQQEQLLEQLKRGKGGTYTEALATTIGHLNGPAKLKARDALAERLARMTAATLRDKLRDAEPEVRSAAALACAMKGEKPLLPDVIGLLEDGQPLVVRAAHVALKDMTKQDFGPAGDASAADRRRAAAAWRKWWEGQGGSK